MKFKDKLPTGEDLEALGRITLAVLGIPILGTLIILSLIFGWTVGTALIVLAFILLGLALAVLVVGFVGEFIASRSSSRSNTGL